jgi:AcrR family transcriptional regulator
MTSTPRRLRDQIRAQMTEEIKATARRHLAEGGAANLSLRAVARDLGMVSSAVYRYVASRDDLLTALIIDAYTSLGDAAERAEAAVPREDLTGRFRALGHAVRDWARAHPHEYALTYGSPVPGYVAPPDTLEPGSRVTLALLRILVDGFSAGRIVLADGSPPAPPLSAAVAAEMAAIAERAAPGVPPAVMARGMMVWSQLFGAVNFDVFGRIDAIVADKDAWYDHQLRAMAGLVGLPS